MADQGRDPFDEEMDALRLEVGRFVLRLLKDDAPNNDVLAQVGERLAAHVSEKARPVSALNADDRRFLDQLSRRVERLDSEVRRLRSSRQGAAIDAGNPEEVELAEPEAWGRGGLAAGSRLPDLPGWLPWAVSGLLTVALIAAVAFLVLGQRQALTNAAPAGQTAEVDGPGPALRWDVVLDTVETWPDEERLAARRILCGETAPDAVCPSWPERSVQLASDPEGRAAVARVVAQALDEADCAPLPQDGAPNPERSLDPACLLGGAE